MTTGGEERGPNVNSPAPIERKFDISVTVIAENIPFELAQGERD